MLFDAGGNGEDVWIENDVVGIESDLVDKDAIRAFTDADFFLIGCGLAVFIEGHHHHRRAVTHDVPRVVFENFLSLLERDRVDDALALQALQAGLENLPLRRVDHDRHLRHIRFALQQLQVA